LDAETAWPDLSPLAIAGALSYHPGVSDLPQAWWQRDAAAIAEALFSGPHGPPPAERVAWLVDDLDHFLGTVGGRSRLVFHVALQAVAVAAPLSVLRAAPIWKLPLPLRVRALERLEHGPLGMAVFAVKTLLCLHWYEHPDSAIEVGLVRNVTALSRRRAAIAGAKTR